MDLRFTPEENAFRADVRAFMQDNLPAAIRSKMVEGRRLGKWRKVSEEAQRVGAKRGLQSLQEHPAVEP